MPVPAEATPQPGQRFLTLPSAPSPLGRLNDIMMCIKCMIIIMMDGHDFLGAKRGNERKVKEMWSIMEACGLKNNTCLLHRAEILAGRHSAVGTFLAM